MGTRRRVRHHRKRYRGGEEFVKRPFVAPANPAAINRARAAHESSEIKRYNEWKAKREVEAREDAKGREEDAKMAAFNEKQKRERAKELEDLRKMEEERRKRVEEEDRQPSNPCVAVLKEAGVVGKTTKDLKSSVRQFSLKNHPDKGGDTATFQKVYGCYEKKLDYLQRKEASGAGRKTRRRKSHRRR